MKVSEKKLRCMEEAASQKRHWTRLTTACNNNCIFCLDKGARSQGPGVIPVEQVFKDLQKGIDLGCERAILSGGEASLHPEYFRIIQYAKKLGYKRVQTISNGRMFAYRDFLNQAVQAGLQEITFSMHGHTAELHEAQTRIPGSYQQALVGLVNALVCGKVIVNIDIVINKNNYRVIDEIMDYFISLGVHEFDLLHVTPYGDAWDNRSEVFYNPSEAIPHLNRAFAYGQREDLFVWTNRFPPEYLAEYPELIQNPAKIADEVRGRLDLFEALIYQGVPIACQGERCTYCFLKNLCAETNKTIYTLKKGAPENIRACEKELQMVESPFLRSVRRLWLHGPAITQDFLKKYDVPKASDVFLEMKDYTGVESFAKKVSAKRLTAISFNGKTLEQLLGTRDIIIWLEINRETVQLLIEQPEISKRPGFKLYKKNQAETEALLKSCEDMTVLLSNDKLRGLKTVNVPGCLVRTRPYKMPWFFDLQVLGDSKEVSMQKLTRIFIENEYYVFPVECDKCGIKDVCPGVHVNYLRAFGFKPLPVTNKPKK